MGCALLAIERYSEAAEAFRRCVGLDWDVSCAWVSYDVLSLTVTPFGFRTTRRGRISLLLTSDVAKSEPLRGSMRFVGFLSNLLSENRRTRPCRKRSSVTSISGNCGKTMFVPLWTAVISTMLFQLTAGALLNVADFLMSCSRNFDQIKQILS